MPRSGGGMRAAVPPRVRRTGVFLFLLHVGCVGGQVGDVPLDDSAQADLVNGQLDVAHPSVVLIEASTAAPGIASWCTGTLIAPKVFLTAAQNAVPLRVLGSTTSFLQFSRGIGTTFGVTIFGVLVNQGLPREARGDTTHLQRLSGEARVELAQALHPAFLLATCVCAAMLVIAVAGLEERPLRRSLDDPALEAAESPGAVSLPAALEGATERGP